MLLKKVDERLTALWKNGSGREKYIRVLHISVLGGAGSVNFPCIAHSSAFPCRGRSYTGPVDPLSS